MWHLHKKTRYLTNSRHMYSILIKKMWNCANFLVLKQKIQLKKIWRNLVAIEINQHLIKIFMCCRVIIIVMILTVCQFPFLKGASWDSSQELVKHKGKKENENTKCRCILTENWKNEKPVCCLLFRHKQLSFLVALSL